MAKSNDCVKRLKSSHNDRLAMFGQQMKMLVDAVQKSASRFNRPPIGPLGAMIRLQDYTWATAVEQLVKRAALHSFVVDNHRDEATLRGIIRSVYGGGGFKPEVIVSSFQSTAYDVRKNVSGRVETYADVCYIQKKLIGHMACALNLFL